MPCRPLNGALLDSKARRYIAGKTDLRSAFALQKRLFIFCPCFLPMKVRFDDTIFQCDVAQIEYCRQRGQWMVTGGIDRFPSISPQKEEAHGWLLYQSRPPINIFDLTIRQSNYICTILR